jgi:uncharacterized membrane protein
VRRSWASRSSTRRLEAFTDGVFAIAATPLVLNLTVSDIGRVSSEQEMLAGLVSLGPRILDFTISFLLLGLLWTIHVRQFDHIERVDGFLTWMNILRLFGVVLVPFVTSLNDEYSAYLIGRMALPIVFFIIVLLSAVQWFYATAPGRGLTVGLTSTTAHNSRVNATTAVALATAVVILSGAFGSLAFVLFALDPVIAAVLRRLGIVRSAGAETDDLGSVTPG